MLRNTRELTKRIGTCEMLTAKKYMPRLIPAELSRQNTGRSLPKHRRAGSIRVRETASATMVRRRIMRSRTTSEYSPPRPAPAIRMRMWSRTTTCNDRYCRQRKNTADNDKEKNKEWSCLSPSLTDTSNSLVDQCYDLHFWVFLWKWLASQSHWSDADLMQVPYSYPDWGRPNDSLTYIQTLINQTFACVSSVT